MNIQPGRPVKRRSVKQQNNNSTGVSELCSLFAMIGWTAMILGMFGAFFYAYVSLGNRIAAASGDARKLEEDIAREEEAGRMAFEDIMKRLRALETLREIDDMNDL